MPGGAPPAPQRFAGLGVPGALQQLQHAGMQGALAGRGGLGGGGPPPFGLPGGPPGSGGVSGLGAAAAAAAAARSSLASLGMGPGSLGPPGAGGPPRPGLDRTASAGVLGLGPLPPGAGGGGVPLARAPSAGGLGATRSAGFSPAGARAGPGGPPPPHGLSSAAAGSDLLALINKGPGGHDGQGGGGNPLLAGLMGDLGDGSGATPFDLSDFPHLGARGGGGGLHGMGGALGALGLSLEGLDLYGKPSHPEFSIQNTEDFPALPGGPQPKGAKQQQPGGDGSHYGALGGMGMGMSMPPGARDVMHLLGDGSGGFGGHGDDGSDYGAGSYGGQQHAMSMAQQQAAAQAAAARSGAPPRPGGKPGAPPPPPPPATERYGLLGLLSAIRMSDMDLSTLALGTDLTTLGLNLNSAEALHKTFASPWADAPCRPERELATPAAYLQQPPWLAPGLLSRFSAESLFYVFYSCPGEESQLAAAEELAARGWLWHKELQVWLQRAPGEPPAAKGERGERGAFVFFDVSTWEKVRKDNFALDYSALDETPRPRQQPQQQPQQPGLPS
jgi:CCR4-NOT transcription complex subunit 2